ncbi:MAG: zinc ribbon domain-containing protein [Acidimicrobiia bacterium]
MTDKVYLDLLDLQAVDTEIDQLLHRRQSLPELEEFKAAHASLTALTSTAEEQESVLSETVSALSKAEGELELTETKKGSEEMRMFAGGLSAKDLENLQREIEMLGRQIEDAEEQILALLETREEQESALSGTTEQLNEVQSRSAELETAIAEQWKEIDGQVTAQQERRGDFVPLITDDLYELYEKLRPAKEGIGAARLLEGVCGGCHLSMSPAERNEVLKEDPPRCLQCRRILVPQ